MFIRDSSVTSSSLATTLSSYALTSAGYVTSSSLATTLGAYQDKSWVCGYVLANGTKVSTFGQRDYSVSRTYAGIYSVSWSGAHPGGTTYGVLVTLRGGIVKLFYTYSSIASTSFTLQIFDAANTSTDNAFTFMTVP